MYTLHWLELVYGKKSSLIKFSVAKKHKACEMCRRMCDVYREACFRKTMFENGLNCLKKVKIVFKMKTGQAGTNWQAYLKWQIQLMS